MILTSRVLHSQHQSPPMRRRPAAMPLVAALTLIVCSLLLLPFAGCAAKTKSHLNHTPTTVPVQPAPETVQDRLHQLQDQIADLDNENGMLPGVRDEDHRRSMEAVFQTFSQALPLLVGPHHTNEFDQQIHILAADRAQLRNGSVDLNASPTIDQGLRTIHHALASLVARDYSADADISAALATLGSRIDELDTQRGATHRVVVAQAVREATKIVSLMAANLAARIGANEPPATAQAPAPMPTTAAESPAPMPSTPLPPAPPAAEPMPPPPAPMPPSTTAPATGPALSPASAPEPPAPPMGG